jgi:predicted nucleic acid-binding protein
MHLLRPAGGWRAQERLWEMHKRNLLMVADASLVSLAESRNLPRIFTLNSDFAVYRFRGRRLFDLIPKRR